MPRLEYVAFSLCKKRLIITKANPYNVKWHLNLANVVWSNHVFLRLNQINQYRADMVHL